VPVVHDLVSARPLTEIVTHRFSANHGWLYAQMKRFPEGYLVIGDAMCSFNPIYGHGMSVAATEARAIDEYLATGMAELAKRF
jgi:flavin-dependent dehydrogenase